MSGNRVTFRSGDSSPPSSSGGPSRSHHGSRDSGVGGGTSSSSVSSASDRASHVSSRVERAFAAQEAEDQQRYNVQALQEVLTATVNELDSYKAKVWHLDTEVASTRKELRETQANLRGLADENEVLKADRKKLKTVTHGLKDEAQELKEEIRQLREANREFEKEHGKLTAELTAAHDEIAALSRELNRAAAAAAAAPADAAGKPHRRGSARDKSASEKKRLSERFERASGSASTEGSESSGTSSAPKPARKRRDSYVEGWGPGPAGPKVTAAMPQSPTAARHYEHVPAAAPRPGVYVPTAEPAYSVPRTAAVPQVQRPYVETAVPASYYPPNSSASTAANTRAYRESGDYHAYPLPERTKK